MLYIGSFGFQNVIIEHVDVSEGIDKLLKRYRKLVEMAHYTVFFKKHGENKAHTEPQQVLSELREGDVLLVHEISCCVQSSEKLLNIFANLSQGERGLTLQRQRESGLLRKEGKSKG
ncbi:hypothetical protein [Sporosarcina sp. P13]|uniref:hypothetical protein n=1 Tax=Sporosarcina sp. P13 TaxID=2048263 RepID=UPI001E5AA016|nr:hypothetical protein [Sporosarcina sp. P13]